MTQSNHSKNLSEIVADANAITQSILDNQGELSPELEAQLNHVELSLASKVEGYAHLISRWEMEADYFAAQAATLSKIAKAHTKAVDTLWTRIKETMLELDVSEVAGESVVYKLSRAKPKLVINEALLDSSFKDQVISFEVNKEKVKTALDAGELIEGARYEGGVSLRCSKKGATK